MKIKAIIITACIVISLGLLLIIIDINYKKSEEEYVLIQEETLTEKYVNDITFHTKREGFPPKDYVYLMITLPNGNTKIISMNNTTFQTHNDPSWIFQEFGPKNENIYAWIYAETNNYIITGPAEEIADFGRRYTEEFNNPFHVTENKE